MAPSPKPSNLIFLDLETLGLSERHEFFEYGHIDGDTNEELVMWRSVDITNADEDALRINKYYLRYEECIRKYGVPDDVAAKTIAVKTSGKRLAGNNVGMFDTKILRPFLRRHGFPPAWDYRCLDVVDFAAGAIGLKAPWTSKAVSKALGINESEGMHTALVDARWGKSVYEMSLAIKTERAGKIQVALTKLLPPIYTKYAPGVNQSVIVERVNEFCGQLAADVCGMCWPEPKEEVTK